MTKYVYFTPRGGINDNFVQIKKLINYCKNFNRVLLLDMNYGSYNINVHDYLSFENCGIIIYNINVIRKIVSDNKLSLYPTQLDFSLLDIVNRKINFNFDYKGINLKNLPNRPVKEDIIFHSNCGGGDGYQLFIENVKLRENFKKIIKNKLNFLGNKYLCIYIRNTDIKSNYRELYQENKNMIHSYEKIYICTDNKLVIEYFRNKKLNIYNFTTFPKENFKNLHCSNVPPKIKFTDLFTDIFIAVNSEKIILTSKGGFGKFLKTCNLNKNKILKKIK